MEPTTEDMEINVPALLDWLNGSKRVATTSVNPWQMVASLGRRLLAAEAEVEVWRRLVAWRDADRKRIVRIDSTWANEGGMIWSVDLYPGVSMSGCVASEYSRSLPGYNPRLWVGEPGRNATLPELLKAALDYHEELERMKEDGR